MVVGFFLFFLKGFKKTNNLGSDQLNKYFLFYIILDTLPIIWKWEKNLSNKELKIFLI